MVSTDFLIVSIAALAVSCWHIFVVMQLWPPEAYLLNDEDNQCADLRPAKSRTEDVKELDSLTDPAMSNDTDTGADRVSVKNLEDLKRTEKRED